MTSAQIERLKKDSKELDHYIMSLKKRGKEEKAHKLQYKQEYLNQTINEVSQSQ